MGQQGVAEKEDSEFLVEHPLRAEAPSPDRLTAPGAERGLSRSSLLALVCPAVVMEPVVLQPRPSALYQGLLPLSFADDGWKPLWESPECIQRDLCDGL